MSQTGEIQRIADLLRRTFDGDAWYGDSLMRTIHGVSAMSANFRPFPTTHTVWEIVQHLTQWRIFTWQRLRGHAEFDITLGSADDWPPVTQADESTWQRTLHALNESQENLLRALHQTTDLRLVEIVPGRSYTFYTLLHGIIQHDVYHTGQIGLLKKQMAKIT